jgi:GNAT superfamily N-acetyltransferase
MEIKKAENEKDILKCTDVMSALRPQLNSQNITGIIGGMINRGYHLIFIEVDNIAICAAGYRYTEHLHWGKAIYIDDLTTLPAHRKKGYARHLLDFIVNEAKVHQCKQVHLDSGCVPQRYDAHRMYLKYGFNITSHHFALEVK